MEANIAIEDLINDGLLLIEQHRYVEAEALFRATIAREPMQIAAYLNLGCALWHQDDLPHAAEAIEAALTLNPDLPQVHINLGVMYLSSGRYEEARRHLKAGIAREPTAYAYECLGVSYLRQGHRQLALTAFEDAIHLVPNDWRTHLERAGELLVLGRYADGWREYEARLDFPAAYDGFPITPRDRRWDGGFVDHLVIHYEQGCGDTIQSCRYINAASARCNRLTFLPRPALTRLLGFSFAHNPKVTVTDVLPTFDAYQWLESLPGMFGAGIEPIPPAPYLSAPRSPIWQQAIGALPGVKVGIVWGGQPELVHDKRRSIAISKLSELFNIQGVSFVSLQVGRAEADRRLYDAASHLDDWFTTATVVQELDLVISVDTAVAHLAGALGKPIWLLNRLDTCWRWELDRSDSRWYPTMRIFRQSAADCWDSVIKAVSLALEDFMVASEQRTQLLGR